MGGGVAVVDIEHDDGDQNAAPHQKHGEHQVLAWRGTGERKNTKI